MIVGRASAKRNSGVPAALVLAFTVALAAVTASSLFSSRAIAAQTETIRSQLNPKALSSPPPVTPRQGGSTNIPTIPGWQGSNTKVIPLPVVFRGCWAGTVPEVDSIRMLQPTMNRVMWLTKSYKLCYKQVGYNGRWQLTFAEGSVADRRQVSDQRQLIKVKSVSGSDRAHLVAYLHFRAPQLNPLGLPTGEVDTLDELTQLHCHVMPDKQSMEVRAHVFVERNDRPYVEIGWHTEFLRSGRGG